MSLNLLELNSSELENHITMIAISLYLPALVKWYGKNKCIALSYEPMRQNTNTSPTPPPILVFSSEAVDETKPKESARQEEDKGEEREVYQEHA